MNRLKNSVFYQFLLRLDAAICGAWNRSLLGRWLTCQDPKRSVFTPARQLAPFVRKLMSQTMGWVTLPSGTLSAFFAIAALVLAPLVPSKVLAFPICLCLGFGMLLLAADREAVLIPSPLNVHISLYAVVVFWSLLTSVDFSGSLFRGIMFVAIAMFFYGVTSSGLEWHLNKLLWLMLAVCVGVSLYGIFQAFHPELYGDIWSDTDMFPTITVRVYSTFGNPLFLGEYLLLLIPLICAMLISADNWKQRIACLIAVGIAGVCLILTYSRGCYLGLLFAAAVFLVLLDRRFLFLGIIAVALCPLYLPESVITRFASIGNMADSSSSYRVRIWLGSLAMLKDFGFCGVGPGYMAYNAIYPNYALHTVSAAHSHNMFLQLLCDSGIAGLLVFLGLLVSFYRMMFTAIRHETDRRARVMQIGCVSAVSGFMVQSQFDYSFHEFSVTLLFFAFLGLGVLFTRMGKQEEPA